MDLKHFFDQLKQTLIILLNTSKLIRHIIRFGLYINVESEKIRRKFFQRSEWSAVELTKPSGLSSE
jgi:hypothetical protein